MFTPHLPSNISLHTILSGKKKLQSQRIQICKKPSTSYNATKSSYGCVRYHVLRKLQALIEDTHSFIDLGNPQMSINGMWGLSGSTSTQEYL
ncbi:hypothetical protein NPIL_90021 [Nephila pilipes]|uniref:Uncharacterized protein n=1 Tax=Nephila pilipes TaxID=299642 RepID=A0A8X6N140_NEPPI|nr:hypothetical protein NPIL_90021 [Nephila pilipes]